MRVRRSVACLHVRSSARVLRSGGRWKSNIVLKSIGELTAAHSLVGSSSTSIVVPRSYPPVAVRYFHPITLVITINECEKMTNSHRKS